MKRLLFSGALALVILLQCLPPLAAVSAAEEEPRYAVAASEDVWFYASEDEKSGLFLIPYTYYVKIIAVGTLFTAVEYLDDVPPYRAVRGFCKTQDLTFVDFVPARPFLRREIKATYEVENPTGTRMGNGSFDKIERTFVYYGTSYSGTARFFYVCADGVFDYIPATRDIVFELNTDYLQNTSGEPAEEPSEKSGLSAGQIVAICAVALAFVAIAALVLRGKRASPAPQEFSQF